MAKPAENPARSQPTPDAPVASDQVNNLINLDSDAEPTPPQSGTLPPMRQGQVEDIMSLPVDDEGVAALTILEADLPVGSPTLLATTATGKIVQLSSQVTHDLADPLVEHILAAEPPQTRQSQEAVSRIDPPTDDKMITARPEPMVAPVNTPPANTVDANAAAPDLPHHPEVTASSPPAASVAEVDNPNRILHFTSRTDPIDGAAPRYAPAPGAGRATQTHQDPCRRKTFGSLVVDPDNMGRRRWRLRQPPTERLLLPSGFDPSDQSQIPEKITRLDLFQIARSTEVYMEADLSYSAKCVRLTFWGSVDGVRNAIRCIKAWLSSVPRQYFTTMWTKLEAYIHQRHGERSILTRKDAEKYRRPPPSDRAFSCVLDAHWGKRDWDMEEVLGEYLEALDPIRMAHRVYIVKKSADNGTPILRLYGEREFDVSEAMYRIVAIDKQVDAREYEKPQLVLFKHVTASDVREKVALPKLYPDTMASHDEKNPLGFIGYAPVLDGQPLDAQVLDTRVKRLPPLVDVDEKEDQTEGIERLKPGTVLVGADANDSRNLQLLESITIPTLELVNYFRGKLRFRIRLGRFYVDAVRSDANNQPTTHYALEDFEHLINQRNFMSTGPFDSGVTENIGDPELERHMFNRFRRSGSVLIPQGEFSADLGYVCPYFGATFIFHYREGSPTSTTIYQLDVSATAPSGWENGKAPNKGLSWSKFLANEEAPTKMLQVCFADLTGAGLSYYLGIEGVNPVPSAQVPIILRDFANTISFNVDDAMDWRGGSCFVTFGNLNSPAWRSVPLTEVTQRRYWRYRLGMTDLMVELSLLQRSKVQRLRDVATLGSPRKRWGVSMCGEMWDEILKQNESLEIGDRALWKPEEWQFFGGEVSDGQEYRRGTFFRELMENVALLEQVVLGKYEDDTSDPFTKDAVAEGSLTSSDDGDAKSNCAAMD